MELLIKIDLTVFTEEDFQTIQVSSPPSQFFIRHCIRAYRFKLSDPEGSISIAYQRALNNSGAVLAREGVPQHVVDFIKKYSCRNHYRK